VPARKNGKVQHVPCSMAHGVIIDPPGRCCLRCATNGRPSVEKQQRRAAAVAGLAARADGEKPAKKAKFVQLLPPSQSLVHASSAQLSGDDSWRDAQYSLYCLCSWF